MRQLHPETREYLAISFKALIQFFPSLFIYYLTYFIKKGIKGKKF